jgi:hypothetical protein
MNSNAPGKRAGMDPESSHGKFLADYIQRCAELLSSIERLDCLNCAHFDETGKGGHCNINRPEFGSKAKTCPAFIHWKGPRSWKRDPDPNLECDEFEDGKPQGECESDGHYMCHHCKWKKAEETE